METIALILFVVSAGNLALAWLVFRRSPKAQVNRVFAATALAVSVWTVTNALFQGTESVESATLWANVSYVSALVVAAALFHFSQIYPERIGRPRRMLPSWAAWGIWIAVVALSITPFIPHFVINHVELVPERRILTNAGLYPIAAFILVTVLAAMRSLVHSLALTHDRERMQARYALTGMTVTAAFGLVCNLILPLTGNYSLVWLGPGSSLIFVGCTVYSIIKEHLFDIRIIIHRSLFYGLLLAVIAAGYSVVESSLTDLLQHSQIGRELPILSQFGGAVAVSLFISPARKWLEKQLNRIIFRRRHRRL